VGKGDEHTSLLSNGFNDSGKKVLLLRPLIFFGTLPLSLQLSKTSFGPISSLSCTELFEEMNKKILASVVHAWLIVCRTL